MQIMQRNPERSPAAAPRDNSPSGSASQNGWEGKNRLFIVAPFSSAAPRGGGRDARPDTPAKALRALSNPSHGCGGCCYCCCGDGALLLLLLRVRVLGRRGSAGVPAPAARCGPGGPDDGGGGFTPGGAMPSRLRPPGQRASSGVCSEDQQFLCVVRQEEGRSGLIHQLESSICCHQFLVLLPEEQNFVLEVVKIGVPIFQSKLFLDSNQYL
ncbi:PREDICTED: uncharacterized protein LOC108496246 [Lepidothrix coronata]|uniref:Uncharacterized protein LOC108496246 n=1 Tax=Lepidothrix coronata TaxID=321398 RepID=A0A6J0H2I9_9PASS|nr:PREDICTED: uncharacterized protein LOC108496246 [Lepidothrix coronata]